MKFSFRDILAGQHQNMKFKIRIPTFHNNPSIMGVWKKNLTMSSRDITTIIFFPVDPLVTGQLSVGSFLREGEISFLQKDYLMVLFIEYIFN